MARIENRRAEMSAIIENGWVMGEKSGVVEINYSSEYDEKRDLPLLIEIEKITGMPYHYGFEFSSKGDIPDSVLEIVSRTPGLIFEEKWTKVFTDEETMKRIFSLARKEEREIRKLGLSLGEMNPKAIPHNIEWDREYKAQPQENKIIISRWRTSIGIE